MGFVISLKFGSLTKFEIASDPQVFLTDFYSYI